MVEEQEVLCIKGLLSGSVAYRVPMYQRNYDWGVEEIDQLIRDIADCCGRGKQAYYLGTLVVAKGEEEDHTFYDIVDGQQRLTTVALLGAYLRNKGDGLDVLKSIAFPNIDFECRDVARSTLERLWNEGRIGRQDNNAGDKSHEGIESGHRIIKDVYEKACKELYPERVPNTPGLSRDGGFGNDRLAKYFLENVYIIRVVLPERTDLNRYFEVMNTRGEQLERHEVLKAKMMEALPEGDRPTFAMIWEACADMERDVQLAFPTKGSNQDGPDIRSALFGKCWEGLEVSEFEEIKAICDHGGEGAGMGVPLSLKEIADGLPTAPQYGDEDSYKGASNRRSPIVDFSNFLLHVLACGPDLARGAPVALDDKDLLGEFESRLGKVVDGEQVKGFAMALLKCRCLFDRYVIKRDHAPSGDRWSLKGLTRGEKGKVSERNTFSTKDGEGRTGQKIMMLLAAMHVSFPARTRKYWLLAVLRWLYGQDRSPVDGEAYLAGIERTAAAFVFGRYLGADGGASYESLMDGDGGGKSLDEGIDAGLLQYGTIRHNFVFNYLDYCLWKRRMYGSDVDPKVKEFTFTFRSSVEHFCPRNGAEDRLKNGELLDSFGNLALISHSQNSRLSDRGPQDKKGKWERAQNIESMKMYLMIEAMGGNGEKWGDEEIRRHGEEMIDVLKEEKAEWRRGVGSAGRGSTEQGDL